MSWEPCLQTPDTKPGKEVQAPLILNLRAAEWDAKLQGKIDTYTSDPLTLDLLTVLIRHLDAQVIVEAGTYRGWGAFTMAEALKASGSTGHIWTSDPTDYEVTEILRAMSLDTYVTYHHETFEAMLPKIAPSIDLAYIDASDSHEENLRLRYLSLVLPRMQIGGIVVMDDIAGGWEGAAFARQLAQIVLPGHRGCALFQRRM